jgi:hypothetical protein
MIITIEQYSNVIKGFETRIEVARKFQAEQAEKIKNQENLLRQMNNKVADLFNENMRLSVLVSRFEAEAKASKRAKKAKK